MNTVNKKPIVAEAKSRNRKDFSAKFNIPPLSTMVFKYDYVEATPEEVAESKAQNKGKIKTIPAPKRGGGKKKAPVKNNTVLKNNCTK